jgi:hypothetical protein
MRPQAPESRTGEEIEKEYPDKSPNTAKTDSLMRSIAGLIFKSPSGIQTIRPTRVPPVIRIGITTL